MKYFYYPIVMYILAYFILIVNGFSKIIFILQFCQYIQLFLYGDFKFFIPCFHIRSSQYAHLPSPTPHAISHISFNCVLSSKFISLILCLGVYFILCDSLPAIKKFCSTFICSTFIFFRD